MSDQRHYEKVADELQRRFLRPGLWTRAVAEAGNDDGAARALYIRFRVAELVEQERAERAQAEAHAARQRKAEALGREEEKRRREEQDAAQRLRMEAERAGGRYGLIITVIIILLIITGIMLIVTFGT